MQDVIDWTSDRSFRVWRYGIGHSQLLIVSQESSTEAGLGIHFEAVQYMRLVPSFRNLRVATADDQQAQEVKASCAGVLARGPLLMVALHHDDGVGLVACSRLQIGQFHGRPTSDFDSVQLHVLASW